MIRNIAVTLVLAGGFFLWGCIDNPGPDQDLGWEKTQTTAIAGDGRNYAMKAVLRQYAGKPHILITNTGYWNILDAELLVETDGFNSNSTLFSPPSLGKKSGDYFSFSDGKAVDSGTVEALFPAGPTSLAIRLFHSGDAQFTGQIIAQLAGNPPLPDTNFSKIFSSGNLNTLGDFFVVNPESTQTGLRLVFVKCDTLHFLDSVVTRLNRVAPGVFPGS